MSHTPTPWAYDEQRWTNHTRHIIHAGDQLYPIADVAEYHLRLITEARANAALIVRAVNAHAQLVEALEVAVKELEAFYDACKRGEPVNEITLGQFRGLATMKERLSAAKGA